MGLNLTRVLASNPPRTAMQRLTRTLTTAILMSTLPGLGCVIVGPDDGTKNPGDAADEGSGEADGQAASASRIRESASASGSAAGDGPRRIEPSVGPREVGMIGKAVPLDPTPSDPGDGATSGAISIERVVPMAAAPGSLVAIYGAGFGADAAALSVSVGGVVASIERSNDAEILAVLGVDASAGEVSVTRGEGRGATRASSDALLVLPADGGFGRAVPGSNGAEVQVWAHDGVEDGGAAPDLTSLGDPAVRTRTPDFSLSSGSFGQNIPGHASPAVAASMRSVLFAEVAGEYEFCVDAPGAARLIIEGFELASSAAGAAQGCGVVGLAPGGYRVQVDYGTPASGDVQLEVTWAVDGGDASPIPGAQLSWADL